MSDLLIRAGAAGGDGTLVDVTPASAGWRYIGFSVVRLRRGERREWGEERRELCVVVLSGRVAVDLGKGPVEIGGRESVFDGPPGAAYVPAGRSLSVEAVSDAPEVALCWAPGTPDSGLHPILITDVAVQGRGEGNTFRTVHPVLMDDRAAESLLVVEVLTPPGNWSSFPPHKHERDDPPHESFLEETYYHRLRPERGFALQRVYTDDRTLDETIAVGDGDVVLVPRGYHVVAAMPGYDLYYLNVMAGPRREWRFQDDPDHAWLRV
ncbi:MAG TPA: 5-deoxy-glucuronate isomerase [Solirubrobacteraceae bacterium]|nr:5-deoxy-glucuronate isomerase [Solirubrobacteraceae bacterium]